MPKWGIRGAYLVSNRASCDASLSLVSGFCRTARGFMDSARARVDWSVFAVTKIASMP